jgi:hypothetical protein
MKSIVAEICRAKREARVIPVLATELELRRELSRRGVTYTTESFGMMCSELATDPRITTIRTLNHQAYAYITETTEESVSTKEGESGAKNPPQHRILSKSAVAPREAAISRPASTVRGVPDDGADNTSDGSGSHYTDKYWWREI